MWHEYFAHALEASFEGAKNRNYRFSLRAFAKKLEVSPGMLSEIFRGHRLISWARARRLMAKADFSETSVRRLERLYETGRQRKPRLLLQSKALDLILNPLYYQTLCAFEVLPPPIDLEALCSFLQVNKTAVKNVVETLKKLGVVKRKGTEIIWNGQHLSTPEDIANEKIQAFFKKNLEQASQNLSLSPSEREYRTVIFAGNLTEMVSAKKRIRSFCEKLSDSMQVEPDQIFQLSVQLAPVSQRFVKG